MTNPMTSYSCQLTVIRICSTRPHPLPQHTSAEWVIRREVTAGAALLSLPLPAPRDKATSNASLIITFIVAKTIFRNHSNRPQQIRDLHENSWCGLIEWTLNISRNSEIKFLEENWAIQITITVRFGPETMKWELILVPEDVLIYIIMYPQIRAQVFANTDWFCSNLVQTLFSAIT